MHYDERMIAPMRAELTRLGLEELRTAAQVDASLKDQPGTRQARTYFTGYAPSSPSIGLLRDGKLVHMIERWQIEGRTAEAIAEDLTKAFDAHCGAGAR